MKKIFFTIAAVFLIPQAEASLITITTADGAGADSFVQKGAAGSNFGIDGGVTIKDSNTDSTTRKGYLRFDLGAVPSTILDAELQLTASTANSGSAGSISNFTVEVFGLAESADTWTEGGITWNNAPGNNTANNDFNGDTTFLGSFVIPGSSVSPGVTYSFSSAALTTFLTTDTDDFVSLLIRREGGNSSNNLAFASKENGTYAAPTLLVTQVPEPTSVLGILGIMTCAVLRRKRRVVH